MHPETGVTLMKLLSLPCSTAVDNHRSSTFNLIKANPLTVKHTSGLDGDRDERIRCLPTHQTILYKFERGRAINTICINITQPFYYCI